MTSYTKLKLNRILWQFLRVKSSKYKSILYWNNNSKTLAEGVGLYFSGELEFTLRRRKQLKFYFSVWTSLWKLVMIFSILLKMIRKSDSSFQRFLTDLNHWSDMLVEHCSLLIELVYSNWHAACQSWVKNKLLTYYMRRPRKLSHLIRMFERSDYWFQGENARPQAT